MQRKDNRRRVVCDDVVDMADSFRGTRQNKVRRNTEDQQREGLRRQDKEAGKEEDMHDPGSRVAWMLPLPQPDIAIPFPIGPKADRNANRVHPG